MILTILMIAIGAYAVYAIDATAKGTSAIIAKRQWWRVYAAGAVIAAAALYIAAA